MYATAHRVESPRGRVGVNAFLHRHGSGYPWPADPAQLPEKDPGVLLWTNGPDVPPGGNRVRSYLDILAPDEVTAAEIDEALTSLWLELVADEASPAGPQDALPNPVVYRHGRVVLRFGVELGLQRRAIEMAELRRAVERGMAAWFSASAAPGR